MAIFLLTLKIIGITLLVILGIIVLLILMILFVPTRYRIDAVIPEEDIKLSSVSAYIRYMHLIRVWVEYKEMNLNYRLKVLCFKINLDKFKDTERVHENESEVVDKEVSDKITAKPSEDIPKEIPKETTVKEPVKKEESKQSKNTGHKFGSKKPKNPKNNNKPKAKKEKGKFKKFWKEIKFYYKMLKDEHNKDAFGYCIKRLKKLLKHYMPRKAAGYVNFGLDDPSNTGLITGFLSLFPFMYTGKFHVYPDFCFDKNYINGEIHIKGHLRLVHLLNAAILIYFNRDVRRFRRLLKRHKQGGIDNVRE